MEYTINKLGSLAGISTRTLRYYDEIGLLKPARISSNGYRIYGSNEVNLLQQIMFYKELGVPLDNIRDLLGSKDFNFEKALNEHMEKLIEKKLHIERLLDNVQRTIESYKGSDKMSDKEKFEGFKKNLVEDNEKKYGKEIREKYGDSQVDYSNQKVLNMSKEDHERISKLATDIIENLKLAYIDGNPNSEISQKVAKMHHEWLTFYWKSYSKEAHAGLAQMYVDDLRFKKYYDDHQEGLAEFLRDIIFIYTEQN
jgi:DNA-binding transcriptional MerR regulator